MANATTDKQNFYTCITSNTGIKCEWPMPENDIHSKIIQLMPTVNWFSAEPDSTRLKYAIAQLQDYCPIIGSRVQTDKVVQDKGNIIEQNHFKYRLDSSTTSKQTTLNYGVGYAEILDLDDSCLEKIIEKKQLHQTIGFAERLDNAFIKAITLTLSQLENYQDNREHNHQQIKQYQDNITRTTGVPRNGLESINNTLAPVWTVLKLGSKNKKYWGILTLCNHCLFDGYGMFSIQKQLAKAYADAEYLPNNFIQLTSQTVEPHPNNFVLGVQLEQKALSQITTNKSLLFSTDFSRFSQRTTYWKTKRFSIDNKKTNIDQKIALIAHDILQKIQAPIVNKYWPDPAKSWVKDLLNCQSNTELDNAVETLAETLALGKGIDGMQDEYGIRYQPDIIAQVTEQLIKKHNFKNLVIASFNIKNKAENKVENKAENKTGPSTKHQAETTKDDEQIFFMTIPTAHVEKIKTYYNKHTDNKLSLTVNDSLMALLTPEHLTAWVQIINIRNLSANIRHNVPTNVLGNVLDFIGYPNNTAKQGLTSTNNNTEQENSLLLRQPIQASKLRRLIEKYRMTDDQDTNAWLQYKVNDNMLINPQAVDIVLNSWEKYSGDNWYPWEFGGNSNENFILQTQLLQPQAEWLSPRKDSLNTQVLASPFRQILVHKINDNNYHIMLLGLTVKDKAAIVNQLAKICQLSHHEAEQHFYEENKSRKKQ